MKSIEAVIQQKDKLQDQIEKMKEAIASYSNSIGDSLVPEIKSEPIPNQLKSEMDRQRVRMKKLEDENSKLKKLLKMQMEKGDALQKETHITVEKLRKEFDSLVKEFMLYKKNEGKNSKNYVPDLGHRDLDKNLGPVLAEGGAYHHKRDNPRPNKRATRESHDEVEEMDVDNKKLNHDNQQANEKANNPLITQLNLGKIVDK